LGTFSVRIINIWHSTGKNPLDVMPLLSPNFNLYIHEIFHALTQTRMVKSLERLDTKAKDNKRFFYTI